MLKRVVSSEFHTRTNVIKHFDQDHVFMKMDVQFDFMLEFRTRLHVTHILGEHDLHVREKTPTTANQIRI